MLTDTQMEQIHDAVHAAKSQKGATWAFRFEHRTKRESFSIQIVHDDKEEEYRILTVSRNLPQAGLHQFYQDAQAAQDLFISLYEVYDPDEFALDEGKEAATTVLESGSRDAESLYMAQRDEDGRMVLCVNEWEELRVLRPSEALVLLQNAIRSEGISNTLLLEEVPIYVEVRAGFKAPSTVSERG